MPLRRADGDQHGQLNAGLATAARSYCLHVVRYPQGAGGVAAIGEISIKYSGTLERYAGDGVMVVFNDPVPVENTITPRGVMTSHSLMLALNVDRPDPENRTLRCCRPRRAE